MQFLMVARDGTDDGAIERRQRTRPTHLDSIGPWRHQDMASDPKASTLVRGGG